jgi:hypothetical protein
LASEVPRNIFSSVFSARVISEAFYYSGGAGAAKARRRHSDR